MKRFREIWSRKNEFLTIKPWQTACQNCLVDRWKNKRNANENFFHWKDVRIQRKASSSSASSACLATRNSPCSKKFHEWIKQLDIYESYNPNNNKPSISNAPGIEKMFSNFILMIFLCIFISCIACSFAGYHQHTHTKHLNSQFFPLAFKLQHLAIKFI